VIPVLRFKLIIQKTAVFVAVTVYGCTVGPDYHAPESPDVQGYISTPIPTETSSAPVKGGESQRLVLGKEIPDQWWSLFQSKTLDQFVRLALKDNPTTAAAQAKLRQAQESLRAGYGLGRFPQLDIDLSADRQKFSGASFGLGGGGSSIFSLYNASVSVSYLLDVFGKITRELEALQAQVDYQRFLLEGSYLTLSANVVTTVVQEASLRATLQATREILSEEEKLYNLLEAQFKLGGVSRTDVLVQLTQLSQTRSLLPPLEKQLAQTRNLLALLLGRFPDSVDKLPELDFDSLVLPRELPLSVPSELTRRRPDVRAAEALLHAASAQIGVATANLYPQITLTGSYGSETTHLSNLFNADTMIWNLGAGLLQPLFHGGELRAERRAAVAAYEEALAIYKGTVLQAFKDVADVLKALEADARSLQAEAAAADAAGKSLNLTKEQFRLGGVSYINLLITQRQYQEARISLVLAQATRFADTAALFQALGGGWWHPVPQTGTETSAGTGKK
jgi:NodT family efflux transporter outer membrane factor (OMF) lipoprotein